MEKGHQDDSYTKEETEQRFKAIARAVLTTPPLKKKDIPRKRPYRARKAKPSQVRKASGR